MLRRESAEQVFFNQFFAGLGWWVNLTLSKKLYNKIIVILSVIWPCLYMLSRYWIIFLFSYVQPSCLSYIRKALSLNYYYSKNLANRYRSSLARNIVLDILVRLLNAFQFLEPSSSMTLSSQAIFCSWSERAWSTPKDTRNQHTSSLIHSDEDNKSTEPRLLSNN